MTNKSKTLITLWGVVVTLAVAAIGYPLVTEQEGPLGIRTSPPLSSNEIDRVFGCSNGEILERSGGAWVCDSDDSGSGGSAITLDIGDDGGDDSVDLSEIATTGDTNSVITESADDKLLIDFGQNWPTADAADALSANGANCSAGEIPLGVDAAGAVESCYEPSEADISDLVHLATSITDGLIIEPDLNTDNAAVDGDILVYDSTGTNFTWQTCAEITGSADLCDGNDATGGGADFDSFAFDEVEGTGGDPNYITGTSTNNLLVASSTVTGLSSFIGASSFGTSIALAGSVITDFISDATISLVSGALRVVDVVCTGCLGTTEIAGLDISDDTNLTAGRSLTLSGDSVIADAELYTDTKCIWFEDPVAEDDFNSIWRNSTANAVTLTEIWAESDQTVNFDLQIDDGTPADVNGTDISPAAGEAEDTSLSGDTTLAVDEELDLAITSVSGTPTWVSICWTYTWND